MNPLFSATISHKPNVPSEAYNYLAKNPDLKKRIENLPGSDDVEIFLGGTIARGRPDLPQQETEAAYVIQRFPEDTVTMDVEPVEWNPSTFPALMHQTVEETRQESLKAFWHKIESTVKAISRPGRR